MISDFSRKDAKMQRRNAKKNRGLVTFVSFVPLCEKKKEEIA